MFAKKRKFSYLISNNTSGVNSLVIDEPCPYCDCIISAEILECLIILFVTLLLPLLLCVLPYIGIRIWGKSTNNASTLTEINISDRTATPHWLSESPPQQGHRGEEEDKREDRPSSATKSLSQKCNPATLVDSKSSSNFRVKGSKKVSFSPLVIQDEKEVTSLVAKDPSEKRCSQSSLEDEDDLRVEKSPPNGSCSYSLITKRSKDEYFCPSMKDQDQREEYVPLMSLGRKHSFSSFHGAEK